MPSLVIWNKTTKEILTSIIEVSGNTVRATSILERKGLPVSDYLWDTVEGSMTTNQCKRAMYVTSGDVVTVKPKMTCVADKTTVLANGTDTVTISGEPSGATVYSKHEDDVTRSSLGTTDGSNVELTFTATGEYLIEIELHPYISWKETINAT